MNFSAWWGRKSALINPEMAAIFEPIAKQAWDKSRENTREAISEYMDFLEDEYPADEWWESLKVFMRGKGI